MTRPFLALTAALTIAAAALMPVLLPGGPALAGEREDVSLFAGCNLKTFIPSYADGSPLSAITGDINGGAPRLWFQVPGTSAFQLYDPASEERSGVTALEQEAGFICVDSEAIWNRPVLRQ